MSSISATQPRLAVWRLLLCLLLGLLAGCGDQPKALGVGALAPEFTAVDLRQQPVSLAAHQGKPVILRFFQPDCKFCRADTAIFNDYYRTYQDKGLGVIYINTAPASGDIQKFVDELGIRFPVVLDPERKIADLYRVRLVPQTVLLDPAHKVLGAILGGVSKEELDSQLLPFLQ